MHGDEWGTVGNARTGVRLRSVRRTQCSDALHPNRVSHGPRSVFAGTVACTWLSVGEDSVGQKGGKWDQADEGDSAAPEESR